MMTSKPKPRQLLHTLRRLFRQACETPLFGARPQCGCVVLYRFPKHGVAEIDLSATFCADYQYVQAIEILDVRECRFCQKRGGSAWFYAFWEGGEAVIKAKLMELAAESVTDPQVLYTHRHHAGVNHVNGQRGNGANGIDKKGAGASATQGGNNSNATHSDSYCELWPVAAPVVKQGSQASKGANQGGNNAKNGQIHSRKPGSDGGKQ